MLNGSVGSRAGSRQSCWSRGLVRLPAVDGAAAAVGVAAAAAAVRLPAVAVAGPAAGVVAAAAAVRLPAVAVAGPAVGVVAAAAAVRLPAVAVAGPAAGVVAAAAAVRLPAVAVAGPAVGVVAAAAAVRTRARAEPSPTGSAGVPPAHSPRGYGDRRWASAASPNPHLASRRSSQKAGLSARCLDDAGETLALLASRRTFGAVVRRR